MFFTSDPSEQDTTLAFKLSNQTPATTKRPKLLKITFDSKLTFLQHKNVNITEVKQTLSIIGTHFHQMG